MKLISICGLQRNKYLNSLILVTDLSAHWTVRMNLILIIISHLISSISNTILFIISIIAIAIVIIINLFARWPPAKKQRQWFPVLHHQSQHNLDHRLDHCLDHHLVHRLPHCLDHRLSLHHWFDFYHEQLIISITIVNIMPV